MKLKQVIAFDSPELFIPRREVLPRADQLRFRCGKCGKTEFRVHVKMDGKVDDLICLHCKSVCKLGDNGRVAGIQES